MRILTPRPLPLFVSSLVCSLVLAGPATTLAQQQNLPPQQVLERQAAEQQALEQDAAIDREAELSSTPSPTTPPRTHATVEVSPELGGLIAREPERFIGKQLVLSEGTQRKTVGPVLAVRQRLDDKRNYLIVDATGFFNSRTQFAIAVVDISGMEGDTLITPAAPGMHLLGRQYYDDEYQELEQAEPAPEQ